MQVETKKPWVIEVFNVSQRCEQFEATILAGPMIIQSKKEKGFTEQSGVLW